jgi:hypothetical protein
MLASNIHGFKDRCYDLSTFECCHLHLDSPATCGTLYGCYRSSAGGEDVHQGGAE